MSLSSAFMMCSGFANIGLAGIFYYYAFISHSSGAGATESLVIIGLMFTVIGLSSFQILRHLGKKTRIVLRVALLAIASIEFAFSFLFFSFAYGGGHTSLLEFAVPLLLASIFSFASIIQEYRETKKRAKHVKARLKT